MAVGVLRDVWGIAEPADPAADKVTDNGGPAASGWALGASCLPNPSEYASPPGSTTATGDGPTPPTRTCSSTSNSSRTEPIGGRWLTLATGIPIHVLREDRILHEARVTGGDVRRMCDLFGPTVEGALRYLPGTEFDDRDSS